MDVIANQVLPAKTEIQKAIAIGDTVETAYDKFLVEQHTRFYPDTKIGNYKALYVQQLALKIQTAMLSKPSLFGEAPIYIVGRFPNGRVDNTDFGIEVVIADPLNEIIRREIIFAINEKTKPREKEFIEVEIKSLESTLVKEAILNPVQVKITQAGVLLQVHDPIQNVDRDQYQLPQNYPAPTLLMFPSIYERVTLQLEKEAS